MVTDLIEEPIKVDLTLSDDEDELIVVKSVENSDETEPKSNYLNKEVYKHFYFTQDQSKEYSGYQYYGLQIKSQNDADEIQYSIICPKCNERFINHNFVRHILDHYAMEYSVLDSIINPKSEEIDSTFVNNYNKLIIESNTNSLRCEICLIDFSSPIELSQHLQTRHAYQDMPYLCRICNLYRTSFHYSLMKHVSNEHFNHSFTLLCPLCQEVVPLSIENPQNPYELNALSFMVHIEKHICKKQFYCDKCLLRFISKQNLMYHRTVVHSINLDSQAAPNALPSTITNATNNQLNLQKKSLNVGTDSFNLSKMRIGIYKLQHICRECNESIASFQKHYEQNNICQKCGFKTRCTVKFRSHMKLYHSVIMNYNGNLPLGNNISGGYLLCSCGYQSLNGNCMASHMLNCKSSDVVCYDKSRGGAYFHKRVLVKRPTDNNKTKTNQKSSKIKFFSELNLEKI